MALPAVSEVETVAIIGTGTIGAGWAAYFLAHGRSVRASDPAPDGEAALRRYVAAAWPALEKIGLAAGADPDRLAFFADPLAAVRGAQFVQESAPERLPLKIELYRHLESALPADVVVATSSSGLLISRLREGRVHPGRFVIGHPFNPAHLIPLVEVVGGEGGDDSAVDWAVAFYNAHGKRAIKIRREVPGHVANRLQAAMWREAVNLVAEGVASVAEVDAAIAHGPGLRWAFMGPHLTFHLAGGTGGMTNYLEHFGPPMEEWWADLGRPQLSPEVRRKLIDGVAQETGDLGIDELARRRDAALVDLLALKQRRSVGPER